MSETKTLAIVWEPLAKVTIGKAEIVVIEEQRCLLPRYDQMLQNLGSTDQEKETK